MKAPAPRPTKPTVWDRIPQDRGSAGAYDLAANVLVGFGLGWLAQRFFPALRPWGYVGGVLLGSASGFYQLFKAQAGPGRAKDKSGNSKE